MPATVGGVCDEGGLRCFYRNKATLHRHEPVRPPWTPYGGSLDGTAYGDHARLCWTTRMAVVLALISSVLWGVADFVGGVASRRATALQVLMVTTPAGLLMIVPVAFLLGGDAMGSAVPGLAAGVFGAFGILLLYAALTIGPMGVLSPVSAVLGAAIPVVVGIVGGERPGPTAYVGMALAVVAIVTVGLEPQAPTDDSQHQRVSRRGLLLAIGAGVGIGMFFACVSFAPDDAGVWPIVWSRSMSTVIIGALALALFVRRGERPTPAVTSVVWLAVLAGALDVAANAFYVLALPLGLLSVVAVLGSLCPAATVLLARPCSPSSTCCRRSAW
jgi:drug/metabolite transporter (DMT)-like permease